MPAVTRDAHGNLLPTKWDGPDQFGSTRRGNEGSYVELSISKRDAEGFATVYPHVKIEIKSTNGAFLFNAAEAEQFAQQLMTYAREAKRVLDRNATAPSVPIPSSEPAPIRKRARGG